MYNKRVPTVVVLLSWGLGTGYSMTNAYEKVRKAVKVTAVRQNNLIIIMLNLVVEVTVYGCTPMPSDKHKFGRVTDG